MFEVKKTKSGKCLCGKKASKIINGEKFCPKCGDTQLIVVLGKCIKGIEQANVKVSIIPKE
jgi:Zn finger protein HypA/HybF involved in hydrogenase expression